MDLWFEPLPFREIEDGANESTLQSRFVQPRSLSIIAQRMMLRLVPYVFPTSNEDFANFGVERCLRVLHMALLGTTQNEFLSEQIIEAIKKEMQFLLSLGILRKDTDKEGHIRLPFLSERAIETALKMVEVWTLVATKEIDLQQIRLGALQMEHWYTLAPSDVSEGQGDIFSTLLENLGSDVREAARGRDLWAAQLFDHSEINSDTLAFWSGFQSFLQSNPEWSFWRDWYQGFLDGKPFDWELQRRVALIPDEDWEKGPEHIAAKIEEIKAAFLAEKAPLAEMIEFNEATAKFFTRPIEISGRELFQTTLDRAEFAVYTR